MRQAADAGASSLNFFSIVSLFLPYMCLGIHRIKKGWSKYPCCQMAASGDAVPREGWEDQSIKWLENRAARLMMMKKKKVRYGIIFIFLAIFISMLLCIIVLKSAGYTPKQIAPRGTTEDLGLDHLFEFFGTFPAWLVLEEVDVPNEQPEMLQLYNHIVSTGCSMNHPIMLYLQVRLVLIMVFVRVLLCSGFDCNPSWANEDQALISAGRYGDKDQIIEWLKCGADIDAIDTAHGMFSWPC